MEEKTLYYRTAVGGLVERTVTVQRDANGEVVVPPVPEGWVELTAEQYATERAKVDAAEQARQDQVRQEEEQRQSEDLAALRQLGLPEATARRLAGLPPEGSNGGG
ncbi:hypothetical protein [Planotetraspora sp. GP83]|uniref:hypothetical protein n=1 Tax=Planotetraspora sp. GP83 TaxID=3156264 RepID=UPI003513A23F